MKKLLRLFSVLVLGAVALGAGWFFLIGKNMKIQSIEVVLDPQAKHEWLFDDIKRDLEPKLQTFKGESLFRFSFEDLSEKVMADPRVKEVYLRREFPSKLSVKILPHEPVLGWVDEKGFIHPVARDNKILPGLRSNHFQDFALLRGNDFKTNNSLRQKALDLMKELPEDGIFRRGVISEIRYRKASGFEVFVSDPSILVQLGEDDFAEKSSRVQKVLSYLQSREINGRVIDSRFSKKVVVRLRNEP